MKTIVKASQIDVPLKKWEFTTFDKWCIDMIIRGTWLFNYRLDAELLKISLEKLLSYYPHLAGRMQNLNEIELNNKGVDFLVETNDNLYIKDVVKLKNRCKCLNSHLNINEIKKGEAAPMSIKLTYLKDGSVLSVHCAHACMDGVSFYTMIHNWGKISRNEAIVMPLLNQTLHPAIGSLSKNEIEKSLLEKKWQRVDGSVLLQIIVSKLRKMDKQTSEALIISQSILLKTKELLKEKTGIEYSNHVVLSAIITKMCFQLSALNNDARCSQLSVVNTRSRIHAIPDTFVGNAVSNIATPFFRADTNVMKIAEIIHATLKSYLEKSQVLQEYVLNNLYSATYKLPLVPFDIKGMNASKPTCIYINNMSRFPIYDVDFGGGKPFYVIPHDLPDAVKIFPNASGDCVNVYFSGYLAVYFNKIKNKKEWVDAFFKQECVF